jgi:hypothetical protein
MRAMKPSTRGNMKSCRIGFIVLMLVSGLRYIDAGAPPDVEHRGTADTRNQNVQRAIVLPREDSGTASAHNEKAVLKYLRPVLRSAGKAARVYYAARCYDKDGDPVAFPQMQVGPPSRGKTGSGAVREIFENDKDVTVTEDPSGMIRIMVGKVPSAILQTRIRSLTLKPTQRYNPEEAIIAIESTKDVEDAMRKLGFEKPLVIWGLQVVEPAKGLPHLPVSMKDVTMDQALDLVAKTFRGIVVYGACAGPNGARLYFVEFVWVV